MARAKIISSEDEQFLKDNYKTMLNKDLAEKIGVMPKSITRILKRLGISRTVEEAKHVRNLKCNDYGNKNIEKGGNQYHKKCWIKANGKIRKDLILMYANKQYDNWKDLVTVKKISVDKFILKREARLEKLAKQKNKELLRNIKESKKKALESLQADSDKLIAHVKANPRTLENELEQGKVPVRLDSRTLLYVARYKCVEQEDGSFKLKEGVTTSYKPIGTKISFKDI